MNQEKLARRRIYAFAALIILGLIYSLISWIATHGDTFYGFFFSDTDDMYMDFFNCLYYARDVFEDSAISLYPPLAHCIFYLVYLMAPPPLAEAGPKVLRSSQFGTGIMILQSQLLCVMLAVFIFYMLRGKNRDRMVLAVALALSAPWIFELERGNLVGLSWIFMGLFFAGYDAENRVFREVALISLAICAALKMYPAVLGLLLLKDKRWNDAMRCISYGILAVVIPAMLTPLELKYFPGMLERYGVASETLTNAGYSTKVNLDSVLAMTAALLHHNGPKTVHVINIAKWFLVAGGIVLGFRAKEKWVSWTLLLISMYSISSFSSRYVLIYLIFPLILFLHQPGRRWLDIPSFVLFLGCFLPLTIGNENFFPYLATTRPVSFQSALEMWSSTLLFFVLCGHVGVQWLREVLARRREAVLIPVEAVPIPAEAADPVPGDETEAESP